MKDLRITREQTSSFQKMTFHEQYLSMRHISAAVLKQHAKCLHNLMRSSVAAKAL